MVGGFLFTLALFIAACVWYYKKRSTLALAVAFCIFAMLALIVVKHVAVVVFIAIVAAVVYGYNKKIEVIKGAKTFVDEKISEVKGK